MVQFTMLSARTLVAVYGRARLLVFQASTRFAKAPFISRSVAAPFQSRTVVAPAAENTVEAPPDT
jgi:hypothetical protein